MPSLSTRQKVLIARLLNRFVHLGRSIVRKPMQGEFTRNGLHWHLDLNEGIDLAIYLMGAFERGLVRCYENLVKPGDIVLDIGANIGAHTLPLARAVGPTGRVIAIEATAYAIGKLRANLALNPELVARVTALHSLLVANSSSPIESHIYSSWPLTDQGTTHPILSGALKSVGAARTCTIDKLLAETGVGAIDWIKLDVDGHELSVLQGADKTINNNQPRILMELAPYCHMDTPGKFEALVQHLYDAGYAFHIVGQRRPLPRDIKRLMATIPHGGSINILAEHV